MPTADKYQSFVCTMEFTVNNKITRKRVEAPLILLEKQFEGMVEQAAKSTVLVEVKMSRKEPIWDNFSGQMIEREVSVEFTNTAWDMRH